MNHAERLAKVHATKRRQQTGNKRSMMPWCARTWRRKKAGTHGGALLNFDRLDCFQPLVIPPDINSFFNRIRQML